MNNITITLEFNFYEFVDFVHTLGFEITRRFTDIIIAEDGLIKIII